MLSRSFGGSGSLWRGDRGNAALVTLPGERRAGRFEDRGDGVDDFGPMPSPGIRVAGMLRIAL